MTCSPGSYCSILHVDGAVLTDIVLTVLLCNRSLSCAYSNTEAQKASQIISKWTVVPEG